MKFLYFDCFSGISGDMVLGAVVDAGCELHAIERELQLLAVSGWKISAERVQKNAVSAPRVRVEASEQHPHRGLSAIVDLIGKAGLPPRAAERETRICQELGKAEAQVHNVPVEKVHFHEVGAVDAIVDIVGACVGFELLGVERFACSPLNVGGGTIQAAHGILPVPAPATALLLQGKPTYSNGIERELVTPTGAAIVSALATEFRPQPQMSVSSTSYGAGTADLPSQPNALSISIRDAGALHEGARGGEEESVIEANFDNINPQFYSSFLPKPLPAHPPATFSAPLPITKAPH